MKSLRKSIIIALLTLTGAAYAQEVSTLYFLENAPMRHLVNPAFQPVSDGYVNFTPMGYTSMWAGNNSLTMSDLIYVDPATGKTITALHPNADRAQLMKAFRKVTIESSEMTLDLVSFGFRHKENGYVHIGIMEKIDAGVMEPKSLYSFLLEGGMKDINGGVNNINLKGLGLNANVYTEISGGYSYRLNDQWTIGGKVKFLLGTAHLGMGYKNLNIDADPTQWHLYGDGHIEAAGPINMQALPKQLSANGMERIDTKALFGELNTVSDFLRFAKPAGYGGAIDFGFAYKPIENLQITAAINDLGFIYWTKTNGRRYNANIDSTFVGAGDFKYGDYVVDGKFNGDSLKNDVIRGLKGFANAIHTTGSQAGFANMVTMKLNVGIDANFWDNRIGIGVVSKTKLYNYRLYEEVTLGAALRPCNWFNIAVSYSLVDNAKYSNIGAGISIMPYDGINMTLAMDYIPTSYADVQMGKSKVSLPYKAKGANVVLGFSIVWGTNKKKDSDKDGVWDKLDMCPNTPTNVKVDDFGCPLDSDGDGVPDYLDMCPGTPSAAYGFVDSLGCEMDTDGDSVPDWKDLCPGTPEGARGHVDEFGCELDSDGDGVPDWIDQCPGTPAEARGYVDSVGCELDTDGDGVPDWRDECPNTPAGAIGYTDSVGCELDTDGDGVPDWIDQCPDTPVEARGYVDSVGCELDTDGDGIPDWKDECPTTPGPAYNKGCPEVKREIKTLLNKAMQGIQFETGKAVIKKSSYALMNKIAVAFIENKDFIIEVQGHTDNVGSAQLNKDLSDRRAHAVMDYLINAGVPAERLSAHGYGMEVPIADNKTKAGRAKNRRVEFNITFEEISYETVYEHADSTLLKQHLDSIQPKELPVDSTAAPAVTATVAGDSIIVK